MGLGLGLAVLYHSRLSSPKEQPRSLLNTKYVLCSIPGARGWRLGFPVSQFGEHLLFILAQLSRWAPYWARRPRGVAHWAVGRKHPRVATGQGALTNLFIHVLIDTLVNIHELIDTDIDIDIWN